MDGDEGALLATVRQGHRGDPGGGQPPSSTVPPVLNAGVIEGPEWDSQVHGTVHSGSGAEETVISSGGGEGGHFQGFQRLWVPPGDGDLLQILRAGDLGDNDDWPAVVRNLARAKTVWSRMSRILSREGATPWAPGLFLRP